MADELDPIIDVTPEAPAEATPPPSATPSHAPAAASTPPPQSTPPPTPAAPAYESARDFAAKALGYKADTYSDDESFLRAVLTGEQTLRRQLDEARQLAQYGHLYLQQQQPKPVVADKPDPLARYKAPEFNQAWLTQVERTESGGLRLKEGADPSILPKLHAYQQYQAEAAQKMTSDPVGYFKDMIEHVAAEKAEALFKEQFQKIQGDQYANTFIEKNSSWLLQQDSQGRLLQNPATGQPMLSPAGDRFLYHMQEAERLAKGNITRELQEAYAVSALRNEMYAPAAQGKQAVDAGEAAKQALLAAHNRGNKSGSTTPPESGGPPVQNQSLSLKERLLQLPDEVFSMAASA